MKARNLKILAVLVCLSSTSFADNYKSESHGTLLFKYNAEASKVEASQVETGKKYLITGPVAFFDILLDEKLDENDPRIKSIIYVAKQNPANSVLVSYTNPNAIELAGMVVSIMNRYGVKANPPQLLASQNKEDLKLIVVKIKYIAHHKLNTSTPVGFQK